MSDQTEMNGELEAFEQSIKKVSAPNVSVDRDQLMYNAGRAAAIAEFESRGSKTDSSPIGRSTPIRSIVVSFASGFAAAAVIMASLTFPGLADDQPVVVASNEINSQTKDVAVAPTNPTPAASLPSSQHHSSRTGHVDLVKWVQSIPSDRIMNCSFSTSPVNRPIAFGNAGKNRAASKASRPATTKRLLGELLPASSARSSSPAWLSW